MPDNLKEINGDLEISDSPITELPDGLKVKGNFYINNTIYSNPPLKSLPDNLTVGGFLSIKNSKIQNIPKNMSVAGNLYLYNVTIQMNYKPEILKELLGVKGDIYIDDELT